MVMQRTDRASQSDRGPKIRPRCIDSDTFVPKLHVHKENVAVKHFVLDEEGWFAVLRYAYYSK